MAEPLRTVTWMDGKNGPYSQEIPEAHYDAFVASHDVIDNVESEDAANARLDEENAGTYVRNTDGTFTRQEDTSPLGTDYRELVVEPDVPADARQADYPGAVPGPDQVNTTGDPNVTISETPVFDDAARRSTFTPPVQ